MKQKKLILKGILFISVIFILLLNLYTLYSYEVNIITYGLKSRKITKEEYEWLKNQGEIIYASDQNSPPLAFKDDNGQYKGVIVDFMNALSVAVGQEVNFKLDYTWKESLDNTLINNIDCYGMIPSEERAQYFYFSDPIYMIRGNIVKPKLYKSIKSYKDLKPYTIAVPRGDYAYEFLKEKEICQNVILTKDVDESLELVENKKADIAIGDEPVIRYYMKKRGMDINYETLHKSVYEKPIVMAVPKDEKKLVDILNKGIFKLRKKHTFSNIKEKWYKDDLKLIGENKNNKLIKVIFISVFIVLIESYILYVWTNALKVKIKCSTKELRESKDILNNTLDSITDMVIVLKKDYSIIHANNAFYEFLRKDRYFKKFKTDYFKDIIDDTFNREKEIKREYELNDRTLNINTFPFRDHISGLNKIVMVIKDITIEKLIEKEILQNNKMAAIGELAAGIAHEIRNPLGIIRNYCYLLKDTESSYCETKSYVVAIESNIDRATKIIGNLLNFARISNEELKEINIKAFIFNILLLENKELENNNIEVKVECKENLRCKIYIESLNHIFLNLISNSIDAINNAKRIGRIVIRAKKEDNMLFFEVEDNGCGICEDKINKIFNPFYTSKPIGKGTGLGLYITYNEVEKCKGNIKVKSSEDIGTCFYLNFLLLGEDSNEL
ncbi:MAG: transporter substrate-binding domain-containing protein [Clostridium sp.]